MPAIRIGPAIRGNEASGGGEEGDDGA